MNIWFRPAWRYLTKTVVLMVAFCFLFPFLIWAFEPANFQNPKALELDNGLLEIPMKLGSILESRQGRAPVIVHVRDLHCNYEVQSRIRGIIDYLAEKHGLRLVAIEGAGQPVNVTKLSSFPDQQIKSAVGEQFVRQGKVSGAEWYAATGKYPVELVGIEHAGRYAKEAACVQRFLTDENQGWIYDLREALKYTKASVYGPRLLKFDAHRQAYQTGEVLPLAFASTLVREARSQNFDLTAYPQLKRYVSRRLQMLPIQVDSDALFEEMDALELQLRARLIQTPEERELSGWEQRVDLMENLINISASPEELARYREAPEKYRARAVLQYLQERGIAEAADLDVDMLRLDQALEEVKTFYALADRRSQDFVANLSQLLDKRQATIALLVTGGYHTEEILTALRAQGLSYVSIKPRLTQLNHVNPYFSLLKKQSTPLEKLLAQNQRLMALAPFFQQGPDPDAILDEQTLPEDIRVGYLVMDITLKLRWLNQRFTRGLPSAEALRAEYAQLISDYRANNPEIRLALQDVRVNRDSLLVSFEESPVFALIYPENRRGRQPGLPLQTMTFNGYTIGFYAQSDYAAVAESFPDTLEDFVERAGTWPASTAGRLAWERITVWAGVAAATVRAWPGRFVKALATLRLTPLFSNWGQRLVSEIRLAFRILTYSPRRAAIMLGAIAVGAVLVGWVLPQLSLNLEAGLLVSGIIGVTGVPAPRRGVFFRAGMTAPGDYATRTQTYGAKAANLIEMLLLGLPVPPGFALPADLSLKRNLGRQINLIRDEISDNLEQLETETGQRFGDPLNPLLVSVRSGAVLSMPGKLLTLTNVGLNDQTVEGLAVRTLDRVHALATYAEYMADYALQVLAVSGADAEYFKLEREALIQARADEMLPETEYEARLARYQERLRDAGLPFPQDPRKQLDQTMRAVMASWNTPPARQYRQRYGGEASGTGIIVQQMVGHGSRGFGSGVLTSRDLITGERRLSGEFNFNLPGSAVVGGQVLPDSLEGLRSAYPEVYRSLEAHVARLEQRFQGDIQDVEFTLENGELFILQTRNAEGIIYPAARIRSLRDAVQAGLKQETEVVKQLTEPELQWMEDALLAPRIPDHTAGIIGVGRPAAPGIRSGVVALSLDAAREFMSQGLPVILVRDRSGYADEAVLAQELCVGVIERVGAVFSHASSVFRARRQLKPCVLGVEDMSLQTGQTPAVLVIGETRIEEGRPLTVDGTTGKIYAGESVYTEPSPTKKALAGDYGARDSREYQLYQTVQRWRKRIQDLAWQEQQRIAELQLSLTLTKLPETLGSMNQGQVAEVLRWLRQHRPELLADAYRPILIVMAMMKSFPDIIPEFRFRYDSAAISAMGYIGAVLSGLRSKENRALFFSVMREFEPNLLRRLLYNPIMYHHLITPALIYMGRQSPAELAAILDEYAINTGSLDYSERDNYQISMEYLFSRPLAQLKQDEATDVLTRVDGSTLAYLASDWLAGIEANLEKLEYLSKPDLGALFNRVLAEWEAEAPEKVERFWQVVRETDELQAAPWPYRNREAWMSGHLHTQGVVARTVPAAAEREYTSQRARLRVVEQEIGQLLKEMKAGYQVGRMLTALRERYQMPQWIASTGRPDLAAEAEQYLRITEQLRIALSRAADKPLHLQPVILANLLLLPEFEARFGMDEGLLWEMQETFLRSLPENEVEVATLQVRYPAIPVSDLALLSWAVGNDRFYLDALRQHLYEDLKLGPTEISPLLRFTTLASRLRIGFAERDYVFNHTFLILSNGWIKETPVKWGQTQDLLQWVTRIYQAQEAINRTGHLDGESIFQTSLARGLEQLGADVTRIESVRFTKELVAEISVRTPEGLSYYYLKRDVYPATSLGNHLQAFAGVEGVRVVPVAGQHVLQQDAGIIVRDSQQWLKALDAQADKIPGARDTLDAFFQQLSQQAGRLLASQVLMNLSDSHDRNMVISGVRPVAALVRQGDYPAAFQALENLVDREAVRLTNIDFSQGLMLSEGRVTYLRQNFNFLRFNLGRWFDHDQLREGFFSGLAEAWDQLPAIERLLRVQRDLGLSLPGDALEQLTRRILPNRKEAWLEFIFGRTEQVAEPAGRPEAGKALDYRWIDPAELNPVLRKMAGPGFRIEQLRWRGVHVAEITVSTKQGLPRVFFLKESTYRETQLGNDLQQVIGIPGFRVERVGRRHALMTQAGVPVWRVGLALGRLIEHAQKTNNTHQLSTLAQSLGQLNEQAGRLLASHVMMAYTDGHDENLVVLNFQRIVALAWVGEYDAALDQLEALVSGTGIQFSSVDFSPTRMLGSKTPSIDVKKSGETLAKTFRPWLNLDLWRTGFRAGLADARDQMSRIRDLVLTDDPRTQATLAAIEDRILEHKEDQWFAAMTESTNVEKDEQGFRQVADEARRGGPSAGIALVSLALTLAGLSLLGVGIGPWLVIPGVGLTAVSLGLAALGAVFLGLAAWPAWASRWIRYRWLSKEELQAAIARLGGNGFTIQRMRWINGRVAELHLARGGERRIMYAKQSAFTVTNFINQLQELSGQPGLRVERFGEVHALMADAGVSLDAAAKSIQELTRAASGDPLRQSVLAEFFQQLSYQGGALLAQHVLLGFEDGHEKNILLRNFRTVHTLVRQGRIETAFAELADLLEAQTLSLVTLDVEPEAWVFRDMPAMQPNFALALEALRHFFADRIDEAQVADGFRDTLKTFRAQAARLRAVLQRFAKPLGFYRATPEAFAARIDEKQESKNLQYLLATARSLRPWRGGFLPLGIRGAIGDQGERPAKVEDDLQSTIRDMLRVRYRARQQGRLGDPIIRLTNLKNPRQTIWMKRLDDQTGHAGMMNYAFYDHRPQPDEQVINGMTLEVNAFGEIDLQVITTTRLNERQGGGVGATVVNFLRAEARQRSLTLRFTNVKGPALRVLIGRYSGRIYATQAAVGYRTERAEPWSLQSAAWGKLVGVEEPEILSLEDLIEDALAGMEDRKVGYNFIGQPKSTAEVVEDQLRDSRILASTVRARLAIEQTDHSLTQAADQLGTRLAILAWGETRDPRQVALARILADFEVYLTTEEKADPETLAQRLAPYFEGLEYIVYSADLTALAEALARHQGPDNRLTSMLELAQRSPLGRGPGTQRGFALIQVLAGLSLVSLLVLVGLVIAGIIPATLGQTDRLMILGGWLVGGVGLPLLAGIGFSGSRGNQAIEISEVDRVIEERRAAALNDPDAEYNQSEPVVGINLSKPSLDFFRPPFDLDEPLAANAFVELTQLLRGGVQLNVLDYVALNFSDEIDFVRDYALDLAGKQPALVLETMPRLGFHWSQDRPFLVEVLVTALASLPVKDLTTAWQDIPEQWQPIGLTSDVWEQVRADLLTAAKPVMDLDAYGVHAWIQLWEPEQATQLSRFLGDLNVWPARLVRVGEPRETQAGSFARWRSRLSRLGQNPVSHIAAKEGGRALITLLAFIPPTLFLGLAGALVFFTGAWAGLPVLFAAAGGVSLLAALTYAFYLPYRERRRAVQRAGEKQTQRQRAGVPVIMTSMVAVAFSIGAIGLAVSTGTWLGPAAIFAVLAVLTFGGGVWLFIFPASRSARARVDATPAQTRPPEESDTPLLSALVSRFETLFAQLATGELRETKVQGYAEFYQSWPTILRAVRNSQAALVAASAQTLAAPAALRQRERVVDMLGMLGVMARHFQDANGQREIATVARELSGASSETLPDFTGFADFVRTSQDRLRRAQSENRPVVFVLGHASPDMDAMVGAVTEAYRRQLLEQGPIEFIPVVQSDEIPMEFDRLLGEAAWNHMRLGGRLPQAPDIVDANEESLLRLGRFYSQGVVLTTSERYAPYQADPTQAHWVLVDHNKEPAGIQARVIAIVDHHKLEPEARALEVPISMYAVGSMASIVAQKFIGTLGQDLSPALAWLLNGAMIMDTENRDQKKMAEQPWNAVLMDVVEAEARQAEQPGIRLGSLYARLRLEEMRITDPQKKLDHDKKSSWPMFPYANLPWDMFLGETGAIAEQELFEQVLERAYRDILENNKALHIVNIVDYEQIVPTAEPGYGEAPTITEDEDIRVKRTRFYILPHPLADPELVAAMTRAASDFIQQRFGVQPGEDLREGLEAVLTMPGGEVPYLEFPGPDQIPRKKLAPVLDDLSRGFQSAFRATVEANAQYNYLWTRIYSPPTPDEREVGESWSTIWERAVKRLSVVLPAAFLLNLVFAGRQVEAAGTIAGNGAAVIMIVLGLVVVGALVGAAYWMVSGQDRARVAAPAVRPSAPSRYLPAGPEHWTEEQIEEWLKFLLVHKQEIDWQAYARADRETRIEIALRWGQRGPISLSRSFVKLGFDGRVAEDKEIVARLARNTGALVLEFFTDKTGLSAANPEDKALVQEVALAYARDNAGFTSRHFKDLGFTWEEDGDFILRIMLLTLGHATLEEVGDIFTRGAWGRDVPYAEIQAYVQDVVQFSAAQGVNVQRLTKSYRFDHWSTDFFQAPVLQAAEQTGPLGWIRQRLGLVRPTMVYKEVARRDREMARRFFKLLSEINESHLRAEALPVADRPVLYANLSAVVNSAEKHYSGNTSMREDIEAHAFSILPELPDLHGLAARYNQIGLASVGLLYWAVQGEVDLLAKLNRGLYHSTLSKAAKDEIAHLIFWLQDQELPREHIRAIFGKLAETRDWAEAEELVHATRLLFMLEQGEAVFDQIKGLSVEAYAQEVMQAFAALYQVRAPQGPETLAGRFARTFGRWRKLEGLLIYTEKIRLVTEVRTLLNTFVQWILDNEYLERRYQTEHLARLDREILERWRVNRRVGLSDLLQVGSRVPKTAEEIFSENNQALRRIIETGIERGFFGLPMEDLKLANENIRRLEAEENQLRVVMERSDENKAAGAKQSVVGQRSLGDEYRETKIWRILLELYSLKRSEVTPENIHNLMADIRYLEAHLPGRGPKRHAARLGDHLLAMRDLSEAEQRESGVAVEFTDEPETMITVDHDVIGSCLSYANNLLHDLKGLLNVAMDGKIKAIVMRDGNNNVMATAWLKILYRGDEMDPVLVLESTYRAPGEDLEQMREWIFRFSLAQADFLGMPLAYEKEYIPAAQKLGYSVQKEGVKIRSEGGATPFEIADTLVGISTANVSKYMVPENILSRLTQQQVKPEHRRLTSEAGAPVSDTVRATAGPGKKQTGQVWPEGLGYLAGLAGVAMVLLGVTAVVAGGTGVLAASLASSGAALLIMAVYLYWQGPTWQWAPALVQTPASRPLSGPLAARLAQNQALGLGQANRQYTTGLARRARQAQTLLYSIFTSNETAQAGNWRDRIPGEGTHTLFHSALVFLRGVISVWFGRPTGSAYAFDPNQPDLKALMRQHFLPDTATAAAFARRYGLSVQPLQVLPASRLQRGGFFLRGAYREQSATGEPTVYLPDAMLARLAQIPEQGRTVSARLSRWTWLANRYFLGLLIRQQGAHYYADQRLRAARFRPAISDLEELETTTITELDSGERVSDYYQDGRGKKGLGVYDILSLFESYWQEGRQVLFGPGQTENTLLDTFKRARQQGADPTLPALATHLEQLPEAQVEPQAPLLVKRAVMNESRLLERTLRRRVTQDTLASVINSQIPDGKQIGRALEIGVADATSEISVLNMPVAYASLMEQLRQMETQLRQANAPAGLLERIRILQQALEEIQTAPAGTMALLSPAIGQSLWGESARQARLEQNQALTLGEDLDRQRLGATNRRAEITTLQGVPLAFRQVFEITSPEEQAAIRAWQQETALPDRAAARRYAGNRLRTITDARTGTPLWLRAAEMLSRLLPQPLSGRLQRGLQQARPLGMLQLVWERLPASPVKDLLADAQSPLGQAYLRWSAQPNRRTESRFVRALVRILKAQRQELLRLDAESAWLESGREAHVASLAAFMELTRGLKSLQGVDVGSWNQVPVPGAKIRLLVPGILLRPGNLGVWGALSDILRDLPVTIDTDIFELQRRRLFRSAAQAA